MSYCRFSTNYYNCDIYCYEDISNKICIHVATSRYIFDREPIIKSRTVDDFINNTTYTNKAIKTAKIESIGLPYDGQSFYFNCLEDAVNKMLELKQIGYKVPDVAIEAMIANST